MNMCNINVITAHTVPDKNVSGDFMHAIFSNYTTRIVLSTLKRFGSELSPHGFSMATTSVTKGGMSMCLFSSPGHTMVARQPGGRKSILVKELIDRIIQKYREPFDE